MTEWYSNILLFSSIWQNKSMRSRGKCTPVMWYAIPVSKSKSTHERLQPWDSSQHNDTYPGLAHHASGSYAMVYFPCGFFSNYKENSVSCRLCHSPSPALMMSKERCSKVFTLYATWISTHVLSWRIRMSFKRKRNLLRKAMSISSKKEHSTMKLPPYHLAIEWFTQAGLQFSVNSFRGIKYDMGQIPWHCIDL